MNELATHRDSSPSTELANSDHAFQTPDMPRHRPASLSVATLAGRKSDDYIFEPRESTFFFTQQTTLRSRPVQVAFDRTYQRCQMALYETELIAPIIARDDDKVRALNGAIDKELKALEHYLDGECTRANKLLQDNGKSLNAGEYTNPITHETRVYTPRARVFLMLLQLADDTITTYARLWLEGFMGEVEFKHSVFSIRMRLIYLARDIWGIHNRSYLALQRARRKAISQRNEAKDESSRKPLETTIKSVDQILLAVEERGGIEAEAPDFGVEELAVTDPNLMRQEKPKLAKQASKIKKSVEQLRAELDATNDGAGAAPDEDAATAVQ